MTDRRAPLEERITDLLARQWHAIQTAELADIPAIAAYIATDLLNDCGGEVAAAQQVLEAAEALAEAMDSWQAAISCRELHAPHHFTPGAKW